MSRFNFQAIGTTWNIDVYKDLDEKSSAKLLSRIMARIDAFDKAYSRFRADSLVTKMSKETGAFELPSDAEPMMSLYKDLYDRTGGLFTPLVGDLISDAGYDATYTLKQKGELRMPPSWNEALEYEHPTLKIKKPAMLDFGAAGKGYLIDLVAEIIDAEGFHGYLIDAGGDIVHKGLPAIRVGLEDPTSTDKAIGVATLGDGSIAGSAHNRRAWGTFTHIMNPKTLVSPTEIMAVWVTAKTGLLADALATCLFFVPAHSLADAYDFEYVLIRSDRSVERSKGFQGEIFTA